MEELQALFTETIFNYRFTLIEGYHQVGRLVLENELDVETVALACSQRPKIVHYCVELAKAYPNLNSLPDGKNVSWHKLIKTLPPYEKKK